MQPVFRRLLTVAIVLTAVSVVAAAESPFVGTWKLNLSKSKLGAGTLQFREVSPGEMEMSVVGQSYKFRMDGKEVPALFGFTASWKQIDPSTWESRMMSNGKLVDIDTLKLSPDGRTLTITSKPAGEAAKGGETVETFQRVAGDKGLAGTWKSSSFKMQPETLRITPNGDDGLTLNYGEGMTSVSAKFDGKDYPATGSMVPPNATVALKQAGARALDMTIKTAGKPAFMVSYTLSADGKTLTSTGYPVSEPSAKTTEVYEREK